MADRPTVVLAAKDELTVKLVTGKTEFSRMRRVGVPVTGLPDSLRARTTLRNKQIITEMLEGLSLKNAKIPDIVIAEPTCRLLSDNDLSALESQGYLYDPTNNNYRRVGNIDSNTVVVHPEAWEALTADQKHTILYGCDSSDTHKVWCSTLGLLLAYHLEAIHLLHVDYSEIRPKGSSLNPCSEIELGDPQEDVLSRAYSKAHPSQSIFKALEIIAKSIVTGRTRYCLPGPGTGKKLEEWKRSLDIEKLDITINCSDETLKNKIAAAITKVLNDCEIKFQAGTLRNKLRFSTDMDLSLKQKTKLGMAGDQTP